MKMSISELIRLYESGKLHTEQSTQRNFIYNDIMTTNIEGEEISKAGNVIKTILERESQLPAVYFWNVQDDESGIHYANDEYNIHDGKQRFLSIYYFVRPDKGCTVTTKINGQTYESAALLPKELQSKLLNYELDIVEVRGTLKQEENNFININSNGEPLTNYENVRGAMHGKYLYEFERYIENRVNDLTNVHKIGRGEEAMDFLALALGIIDNNFKTVIVDARDRLTNCRTASFDITIRNFDKKLELYNTLMSIFTSKGKISLKRRIGLRIANYVIDKKINIGDIVAYYQKGLTEPNDLSKWKFETHRTMLDALSGGLLLDPKRTFTSDVKDSLFARSQKCCKCNSVKSYNELEVDHILAWSKGGRTNLQNAQLLCKSCNTSKGAN